MRASVNDFTRLIFGVAPASGLAATGNIQAPDTLLSSLRPEAAPAGSQHGTGLLTRADRSGQDTGTGMCFRANTIPTPQAIIEHLHLMAYANHPVGKGPEFPLSVHPAYRIA